MEALGEIGGLVEQNLNYLIPAMGVFVRLGALLYLLPAIGETVVQPRVRLGIALALAVLIIPLLSSSFGTQVYSVSDAFALIVIEAIYGLVLGFGFRLMVYTLQILGNVVSQALSISQVLGEGIATEPNTTISTMLMMAGVTLLVTMGVHIEAVGVLIMSFEMFPIGSVPNLDGMAYWLNHKSAETFAMGITLALPFIILNFVYNAILGFLNRAMPQLMVSFVGMPAITGAGLFLLAISVGTILTTWSTLYFNSFSRFHEVMP